MLVCTALLAFLLVSRWRFCGSFSPSSSRLGSVIGALGIGVAKKGFDSKILEVIEKTCYQYLIWRTMELMSSAGKPITR